MITAEKSIGEFAREHSASLKTPYYLIDESRLLKNLEKIKTIREHSGAKSVLALKCFSTWSVFDLMRQYMDGTTSSSLYEARLGHEKFGKEVHAYSVVFSDEDIQGVLPFATKVVEGPAKGKRINVTAGETVTVGCSEAAGVPIPEDHDLSPVHFHVNVVNGRLALTTLPGTPLALINGAQVQTAALGNGDRFEAGATTFTVVTAVREGLPAKLWVGGWGFGFVPDGWDVFPGIGLQLISQELFKATITAFEERLPPSPSLAKYARVQSELVRSHIPGAIVKDPIDTQVRGAREALEIHVFSPAGVAGIVLQHQIYALTADVIGVFTATMLENQEKQFHPLLEGVLQGISFGPEFQSG